VRRPVRGVAVGPSSDARTPVRARQRALCEEVGDKSNRSMGMRSTLGDEELQREASGERMTKND
jgi:hypothetical protein